MGHFQAKPPKPIPSDGVKRHYVLEENLLKPPFPKGLEIMSFGAGCFWGTEKGFWRLPGVYSTAVGFQGGSNENPGYYDVCSGTTGHNEVTQVVFDPSKISIADLLHRFWDCHNPTQGDRQGGDRGTQYRSGIYCTTEEQVLIAMASREAYNKSLKANSYFDITTEIIGPNYHNEDRFNSCKNNLKYPTFYYAEQYHQQYLAIPGNRQYCSAEPTGVKVPDYKEWNISDSSIKLKHKPFLPPAFWKSFSGSIRASNKQVVWNKKNSKKAEKEATKLRSEFEALKSEMEKEYDVIIRYCDGCGFQSKADEVKELLSSINKDKNVICLLKDVDITGNMEVSFKGTKDDGFVLVHSKKTKDDGFVDTQAKKDRLIEAFSYIGDTSKLKDISQSLSVSNTPSLPLPPPSDNDNSNNDGSNKTKFQAEINQLITDNKVVIFSKSYCPYCKKAKKQFQDLNVEFHAVELDQVENGSIIQSVLTEMTNISTVPQVFVDSKLIGDSSATVKARIDGKFDYLMNQ